MGADPVTSERPGRPSAAGPDASRAASRDGGRAAGRDGDTVDAFVRHGPHAGLLRYAYLLTGDQQLAEDLVQDVLLKLWQHRDQLTDLDSIEAYARRAITNRHVSLWRRHRGREHPSTLADDPQHHDAGATHSDGIDQVDDLDLILRAASRLPRRQQAALALRYYEDLPYDQIAAALNCPASTARTLVTRALQQLRVLLDTPASPTTGTGRHRS